MATPRTGRAFASATTDGAAGVDVLTVDGGIANEFRISNTGTQDLFVNIPVIHDTYYDTVAAGETEYYRSDTDIPTVNVKDGSSATSYTAGVTSGGDDSSGFSQ